MSRVPLKSGSRFGLDILLVTLLFGGGVWCAGAYQAAASATGLKGAFYQSYFEPAVLLACGHGFVITSPDSQVPELEAFLATRVDSFDCGALPPTLTTTTYGMYQYSWFYLMMTVSFAWKLLGVSWSALAPLFSLLFGTTIVLAYGLFRLGIDRMLSAVCAVLLTVSTLHLVNLPHLRDYAKAPFVLALILLLGWLVTRPGGRRRVLAISAAYGVILGVGYGFRTDLLVNIPPFFVTTLGFLPGGVLRRVRLKLAAVALCMAAFAISAWPVARYVTAEGGCQWHVMFLGLMTPFDRPLGIVPADYDWGSSRSDSYAYAALGGFPERGGDGTTGPRFCGPEYDAITAGYLMEIATTFPADVVTRAYASMIRMSNLPFSWRSTPVPEWAGAFYETRAGFLEPMAGKGPVFMGLTAAVVAAVDLRVGLWVLFVLVYFGGYPMLQFHPRHHFHLEWIGWFAAALPLSVLARGSNRAVRRLRDKTADPVALRAVLARARPLAARLCIWAFIVVAITWGLPQGLRAYQSHRVRAVLQTMEAATSEPVATKTYVMGTGAWLIEPTGLRAFDQRGLFWGDLLRIELDTAACGPPAEVTLRYDESYPEHDYTRAFQLPGGTSAGMTIFAPVFRRFLGIAVPAGSPDCVRAVYRSSSLDTIRMWLFALIPHERAGARLFQTIEPSLMPLP